MTASFTTLPDESTPPPVRQRSGPIHWDRWFLAIGVPFGVLLLVLLPPANSADEGHHLARIDQIVRGHVIAPLDSNHLATGQVDGCLNMFLVRLSYAMSDTHWRPADAFHQYRCGRSTQIELSNVALNSPVAYGPALVGYVAGRAVGGVLLGFWLARIFGLAWYLGVCWLAIRVAPSGKPFLMFLALLPTPFVLATTMSADPMAISLGLFAVALVLRLRIARGGERVSDPTRWLLPVFAVCLLLLAMSKNLYGVMGLLVLLVPGERFSSPRRHREYVAGVLVSITAATLAWGVLVLNRVRVVVPFLFDDSFAQRAWIRAHPGDFARLATRSVFGTTLLPTHTWPTLVASTYPARAAHTFAAPPLVSLIALGLAVLGLAVSRTPIDPGSGRASTLDRFAVYAIPILILGTVLALVVYGEALTFTHPLAPDVNVTYVEGRFFVPVLGVLLLPLARSRRVTASTGPAWACWTICAGSAGIVVWSLAWLIALQY